MKRKEPNCPQQEIYFKIGKPQTEEEQGKNPNCIIFLDLVNNLTKTINSIEKDIDKHVYISLLSKILLIYEFSSPKISCETLLTIKIQKA